MGNWSVNSLFQTIYNGMNPFWIFTYTDSRAPNHKFTSTHTYNYNGICVRILGYMKDSRRSVAEGPVTEACDTESNARI